MANRRELVLYYHTRGEGFMQRVRMLKSIMVQMGIRIKTIEPGQIMEKVGYLVGIEGYLPAEDFGELPPLINQDMLVLHNFSRGRMDALLAAVRKAKVPRIDLKAVITPQNIEWTFYHLYRELMEEHKRMHKDDQGGQTVD